MERMFGLPRPLHRSEPLRRRSPHAAQKVAKFTYGDKPKYPQAVFGRLKNTEAWWLSLQPNSKKAEWSG